MALAKWLHHANLSSSHDHLFLDLSNINLVKTGVFKRLYKVLWFSQNKPEIEINTKTLKKILWDAFIENPESILAENWWDYEEYDSWLWESQIFRYMNSLNSNIKDQNIKFLASYDVLNQTYTVYIHAEIKKEQEWD
jgi:hypothetical protein